jgi:hypothetical protein
LSSLPGHLAAAAGDAGEGGVRQPEGLGHVKSASVRQYVWRFFSVAALAMFVSSAVIVLIGALFLFPVFLIFEKSSLDILDLAFTALFLAVMVWFVMFPAMAAFALILSGILLFVTKPRAVLFLSVALGFAVGAIALADIGHENPGKLGLHTAWWSTGLVVFALPISACICSWISRRWWHEGVATK